MQKSKILSRVAAQRKAATRTMQRIVVVHADRETDREIDREREREREREARANSFATEQSAEHGNDGQLSAGRW